MLHSMESQKLRHNRATEQNSNLTEKRKKEDSKVLPISDVFQVLLAQYEPCEVVYFGKVYYASFQRPVQGKILQT